MRNEIITYREMCDREGIQTLQRGMNFRISNGTSVILMSLRTNAPYNDRVVEDGRILVYEGHDAPQLKGGVNPKMVDQPEYTPHGRQTQNGIFHEAAQEYKKGLHEAELVRVYQKLFSGVWSYNGTFRLIDSWKESAGNRNVFKFRLELTGNDSYSPISDSELVHNRVIPAEIKRRVWKRDKAMCVKCGSKDNLHFDHILPFSKGGASITDKNIQLLCARHNLQKSDNIE